MGRKWKRRILLEAVFLAAAAGTGMSASAEQGADFPWMIRVNGEVYESDGEKSSVTARCGMMDGEISSEVEAGEVPVQNDQSNFGVGYGYQYLDGAIDVYMPEVDEGSWIRFVKADGEGTELFLADAPAFSLTDALSSRYDPFEVKSGNYTWNCAENGVMKGIQACGAAPLEEAEMEAAAKLKLPDYNRMDSVTYTFSTVVDPDVLTVSVWSAEAIGKTEEKAETEEVYEGEMPMLELEAGKVYLFQAEWLEEAFEERGFFGKADYVLVTE
ncbi:MAG: hypothetical protein Q4F41_14050 [Eubacteriales bacterium]|nr:hypothetical protein [Eubacteriales bacterium]